MAVERNINDSLPESPITWQDIPLGPGQDPGGAFSRLQWTEQGERTLGTDIRRDPDNLPPLIVSRWPERW